MRLKRQSMYDHHRHHADERQQVEHDAEHRGGDEILRGVDVAGQPDDHVAGLPALVEGERQALDVVIEQVAQVEADALADGRRQILLRVGC